MALGKAIVVMASLCGVVTIGCMGTLEPASNGLTLTSSEPAAGLAGEFQEGDTLIYFEARRGSAAEPIVARFVDQAGRLLAMTGDEAEPPAATSPVDPAEESSLNHLIGRAGQALAASKELGRVEEEKETLIDLARGASDLEIVTEASSRSAMATNLSGLGLPCSLDIGKPRIEFHSGVAKIVSTQTLKCSKSLMFNLTGRLRQDVFGPDPLLAEKRLGSQSAVRRSASFVVRAACKADGSGSDRYGETTVSVPGTQKTFRGPNARVNCPL